MRELASILFGLSLVGCASTVNNAAPDATPDVAPDAAPDVAPDAAIDAPVIDVLAPDVAADVRPLACSPVARGRTDDGCFCNGAMAVLGAVAYRFTQDLTVYSLDDRDAPRRLAQVPSALRFHDDVGIAGDRLYAVGEGIEVFDLRTPVAPRSLGSLMIEGLASGVSVVGTTAWVGFEARDMHQLLAIDVSDPTAMRVRSTTAIDLPIVGVRAAGARVFALSYGLRAGSLSSRVDVFDTSAGAEPARTQSIELEGSVRAIELMGSLALVIGDSPALRILDITPTQPVRIVGRWDRESLTLGVAAWAPRALITGESLTVLDLTRPEAPREVASLSLGSDHHWAYPLGSHALVSGGNDLTSIALGCRESP